MKKSLVKLAALTSAAFVLAGPVTSVAVAQDVAPSIASLTEATYNTEDEAITAFQNAKLIWNVEGIDEYEVVKKDNVWKIERKLDGYATEAEAIAAAKEALKTDGLNNSYKITQGANGRYFYQLFLEKTEEVPAEPTPELDGYATEAEAIAAAEEALKKDEINNSYTVSQGANGRWYYVLSAVEVEKPAEPKPETPVKDLDTVKKEALARLDQLQALTQAEREKFTKAILNAKSANEVAEIIKEAEDVNFSVNLEAETPAKEVKPEESKKEETKKEDKKEKLPETGEVSSFAIFGGAALSVLAGLGLVASKKEEN